MVEVLVCHVSITSGGHLEIWQLLESMQLSCGPCWSLQCAMDDLIVESGCYIVELTGFTVYQKHFPSNWIGSPVERFQSFNIHMFDICHDGFS